VNIEAFIEAETGKMSWLDRLFRNYPDIKSTKAIDTGLFKRKNKDGIFIKTSKWKRVVLIAFLLYALWFWAIFLHLLFSKKDMFAILIFFFLAINVIIGFILWHGFINSKLNYRLKISNDGISTKKQLYLWREIEATYILSRVEGRYSNFYLLIFLKCQQEPVRFNFERFSISKHKLASIVESYQSNQY
jgi:hypothetical protein